MDFRLRNFLRKIRFFRFRSLTQEIKEIFCFFLFTFILILIIFAGRTKKQTETENEIDQIPSNKDDFIIGFKSEKENDCIVTSDVKSKLKSAEEIWKKSVEKRKAYVRDQGGLGKVDPWPSTGSVYYWDYFPPSFNCPHLVERIGGVGDGGKWTCGFDIFERFRSHPEEDDDHKCIVYSFGVANESSFESEFLERTNCDIYAFDFTVDGIGSPISEENPKDEIWSHVTFQKIGLGDGKSGNDSFQTLGQIMQKFDHKWIDFLKIDIEGNEFPCLTQIMEEFEILPFGQLNVEIHVDHFGRGFPPVYKWWERMETKGLRPFKSEVNHNSCVSLLSNPVAVEYSFLNVKGDHLLIR